MIFESRKSLFLHRRKLHPSLPKIKSEASSTSTISETGIKGEPFKPTAGDLVPKTEQVISIYLFQKYYVYICIQKNPQKPSYYSFISVHFSSLTYYQTQTENTLVIVVIAHLKTKSFYFAMLLVTMKRNHLSVSNAERNLPKLVFFVTTENDILKLVPSNADIAKRDFTLQIRYFGFFFRFPCYRIYLIPIIFTHKIVHKNIYTF